MRYLLFLTLVISIPFLSGSCKNKKSAGSADEHSLFLVRHAEKGDDGTKNPPLTTEGIKRAESLADLLKYENITKVYSTNFTRTKETAKPIAHRNKIEVEIYDPGDDNFARKLKNELLDHNILVVGHSNSTPQLVNAIMGEDDYSEINEDDYTNLFIINQKDRKYKAEKKSY